MRLGCSAYYPATRFGLPFTLDDYLRSLGEMRAAGFAAVEMEVDVALNLEKYRDRANDVKAELARQGLSLCGVLAVVQQAFSMDRDAAARDIRRFRKLTGLVAELDCPLTVVWACLPEEIRLAPAGEASDGSGPLWARVPAGFDWSSFWGNAVERLAQMARIAGESGQRLAIENRVGDFVNSSDGILRLVEEAGEENVGVLLDVANANVIREHLELVIPKLGERLMCVHLSDNHGTVADHLPAGRGNIDFCAVLRSLAAIGYDGYVNVDFGGVPADEIYEDVRKGRKYFEGCLSELQEPRTLDSVRD
jgi:sugar phosphate isomerase/epimerase